MSDDLNRPQQLYHFLSGLSELTRKYNVVIEGMPTLEFKEVKTGLYCIDPNRPAPEFSWKQT